MQIEDLLNPWIRSLESSFEPYPKFVEAVVEKLKEIEAGSLAAETPRVKKTDKLQLSEKKVLLVDDAEINRVLLSHYFKGFPVQLDFAASANLASDKCKSGNFDLVVIDFDSKGAELAKGLRAQGVSSLLIALSPNSFSETEKESALQAGFNDYLSRGLPKEVLIASLKSTLWNL